ncbi:uncharacterized protein KQ657_002376 [Scheffersomyces spartinae]|uniref:UspA domain-containing protein n=1 Tax=Scheffersomyces spartinae TaxID=45513 RepID=A0A9P7VDS1_9ASCO|nr:uncharacterized protein KQ657_002376 [Scheffersomyces spartinae]KAG7195989.1 hypothetical protein KQ657_002376 [Scheffersomyces spartinae]
MKFFHRKAKSDSTTTETTTTDDKKTDVKSQKVTTSGSTSEHTISTTSTEEELPSATSTDHSTSIDVKALVAAEKSKLQKHKNQTKYLIRSLEDEDEETKKNTEINSLLYGTSSDTVDMYKLQNSSSDLLGRLYYDDYDSDLTPTVSLTPVTSGETSGGTIPSNEYILERIKYSGNKSTASSTSDMFGGGTDTTILSPNPRHPGHHKLKRGITFDASTNNHHSTITLKLKHEHFKFRRNNKNYLVGFAGDLTSYKAIEWLFDEMIVNGDTLIVLHVLDDKSHLTIDREKAQLIMNQIQLLNIRDRKIAIVLELALGKPMVLLREAVEEYDPQIMVIGSKHYNEASSAETGGGAHHRRGFMSKQSMSKHFLECALVPVIIIKSTYVHEDELVNPIESETYFQDWLKQIDLTGTYMKEKKLLSRFLSPSSSKTDLTSLRPTHSAKDNYLRPSLSRDNLLLLEQELRGRDLLSPTNSRLSSRSRSQQRSKATFSLFHH